MPNDGPRPRTSHGANTINRFFSLYEHQQHPRFSINAPSVFDSASGLHLSKNHTVENLECRPSASENLFKRTFDMVERVTKRSNSKSARLQDRPEMFSASSVSIASTIGTPSIHGLTRRESISSASHRTAKRLFNSLRQRRGAVSGASGQTLSQAQRTARSSEEMLHSHWSHLPAQAFQPGSGSAAKAAAQQANLDRQQQISARQKQPRADTPEDPMDVDSAYEADDDQLPSVDQGTKLGSWDSDDFDIEGALRSYDYLFSSSFSDADLPPPDPLVSFPTELAILIFSYLDHETLSRATQVSKKWHRLAESPAVWRTAFLQAYKRRPSNPLPYVRMGGLGLGEPGKPDQPWKEMSKTRLALEKAWKKAEPKAIYFNGHTDSVYCCQFDETKLITGSRDRTIRVWDMNTYKCLRVIGGPASKPTATQGQQQLDVTNNTYRNYASVNGTPEGDAIFHVPKDYHSASILCLQYDHEIMVTGSSDSTCLVWDIHTFEPIKRLRRHAAGVLDVCIDDRYIISCSKDATICVWDRKTLELIKQLEGHRGPVNAVQLRGKLLVSASGDGKSKLWDMETLSHVRDYESRDRGLAAVEFSDDGRYVLAGGNDQVIYKYDARTADLLHTMKGHSGLVRSLFLDYANKRVLSGSYDQGIRVYDFESGDNTAIYDNWTTSWILAAKSDYRRIVATSQDGRALLMDFGLDVDRAGLLAGCARPPAARAAERSKHRSMAALKREDSAGPRRDADDRKRPRRAVAAATASAAAAASAAGASVPSSFAAVAAHGHRLSVAGCSSAAAEGTDAGVGDGAADEDVPMLS